MMRCLPHVPAGTHHCRRQHHARSAHHLPDRANIIEKTSSFDEVFLVVLSGHNSNNYTTLITHKRKLCQETRPDAPAPLKPEADTNQINQYGETEVHRITTQQKRLTEPEIQEIVQKYNKGANCCELAKQYGCHHTTISGALKKAGIEVRNGSTKVLDEAAIIAMYENGQTMPEIAKQFDVDPHTIADCLKKNNIHVRTRWDYSKIPDEQKVVLMYESGQTVVEIARQIGVSPPTISTCLKRNGVTVRKTNGKKRN